MKRFNLLHIVILFSLTAYSQKSATETVFWRLTELNGEINVNGSYWDQSVIRYNAYNQLENSFVSSGLFVNTRSFFWHPNFLTLDLNAGYSPETGQRLSLVSPDRDEVNTLKKIFAKATFFKNNTFNISFFTNLNETYNNRENLTNFKSNYGNWGGTVNYTNKVLPITMTYNRGSGEQKELETNRSYRTQQNRFEGRAHKSFGALDWHQLSFSYNENIYENAFGISAQNQKPNRIANNIGTWRLTNKLFFDKNKNYILNSSISNAKQLGDFEYQRFQILENILIKLPKKFKFSGNYSLYNIKGSVLDSRQHNLRAVLFHQLYESLRSNVFYEYNTLDNFNQYGEKINRAGLELQYDKKIPLKGILTLSYRLNSNRQDRQRAANILNIQNEEYTITDGDIILLNNQNIDINSIVVRDITGTIIYQSNFDYILIVRDSFIEIQRIPGGLITNDAQVFIDYTATQPQSHQFNGINNFIGARISLFENLIEFYYNTSKQDYIDPVNIDFVTLNYFTKNVYGTRFRYKLISGGVEYDNYQSTIVPYRMMRYYLILQGSVKQKIGYTINGDIRDYGMILKEGNQQKFYNISGNISYNLTQKTKLRLQGGLRKQEGEGIDLDFLTSRLELSTHFRQLYITAGLELYKKELFNDKTDFHRANIQISRRF